MIPAPQKLVLDTNVCLDLFVFNDPRWASLLAAMESGAVHAITREDCRAEYLVVLHYKHLPLDEASRAACRRPLRRPHHGGGAARLRRAPARLHGQG